MVNKRHEPLVRVSLLSKGPVDSLLHFLTFTLENEAFHPFFQRIV